MSETREQAEARLREGIGDGWAVRLCDEVNGRALGYWHVCLTLGAEPCVQIFANGSTPGDAVDAALAAWREATVSRFMEGINARPAEVEAALAAAQARERELRDMLNDDPAWIRALGEHGPQIVVESEEAQDARWIHDPGFVTKLAEVMRVYANAMAARCEKRNAALARPADDAALVRFVRSAWSCGWSACNAGLDGSQIEKDLPALLGGPSAEEEPQPVEWRCESCGATVPEGTRSHGRAEHARGCDGSCRNCPVEVECGPCGPSAEKDGGA